MRGTKFRVRHLVGAGALASSLLVAGLSFASLPAGAQSMSVMPISAATVCPTLSVGNPGPGSNLFAGAYVISGEAFDPAAPAGTSGVSRVDLFLGLRDQGGTILGSAVPGATDGENPRFFTTQVTIPDMNEGTVFAAYAISSITGQETSVSFPVLVGTLPRNTGVATPTPVPTDVTVASTCAAGTGAAASVPAASAPSVSMTPSAPTSPSTSTSTAPVLSTACPVLSLGNPGPGDTILAGDLWISGSATDPAAATAGNSGVERVDLFLGRRDQGGTFLGSATPGNAISDNPSAWTVLVNVPNLGRGLDFAAYAVGNNGQETTETFPVFVGTHPPAHTGVATPTPVPGPATITTTCTS